MSDRLDSLNALTRQFMAEPSHIRVSGLISEVAASHVRINGVSEFARIGELVSVETEALTELAEIVYIERKIATAVPHERHSHITLGSRATLLGQPSIRPHDSWLGRVIDPLGQALDDAGPLANGLRIRPLDSSPPRAMDRNRVHKPLKTGVKAIDSFLPILSGQRMGIFAGSGVGKSTLLAMLTAIPDLPVVVIALVGERGREVREFLEDVLSIQRERVVAVVATGDTTPAIRRLAPKAAMTIAEHFRDQGHNVLLMMDSITRFAHAQREYALASSEPPVARGYPPSVFAEISRVLERGGPGPAGKGDITTITTVLVDGDDHNDPISDAARGILDGHIILDRKIAAMGRWPAIDILASLSRLADKAWNDHEARIIAQARSLVSRYEDTRDLRLIGGYQQGTDPELDRAVAFAPRLYELMKQRPADSLALGIIDDIGRLLPGSQPAAA